MLSMRSIAHTSSLFCALLIGCQSQQVGHLENTAGMALWHELEDTHARIALRSAPPQVSIAGSGVGARVSFHAESAEIEPLMKQLLQAAQVPYILDCPFPSGYCSGHLVDVPLMEALDELCLQASLKRTERRMGTGRLWVFSDSVGAAVTASPGERVVYRSYSPAHMQASQLVEMLKGPGGWGGLWGAQGAALRVGTAQDSNTVLLSGKSSLVETTLHMLQRCDQALPQVWLDCLFVEVDEELAQQWSAQLNLRGGPWILDKLGSVVAPPVATDTLRAGLLQIQRTIADAPTQIATTQPLKAVIGRRRQDQVTRTQAYTLSGQPVEINIGATGYLLITTFARDTPSVDTTKISTGVILKITPQVLPNDTVRLVVEFERSFFSAKTQLAAAKFSSKFSSTFYAQSGCPVVVGGLLDSGEQRLSQGYGGARDIPILQWLANASERTLLHEQRVFILIPRIVPPTLRSEGLEQEMSIPLLDQVEPLFNLSNTPLSSPLMETVLEEG